VVNGRADWERILFVSSESALQIPVEMIHYGVTKTAQLGLAEPRWSRSSRASARRA
jgi:hypothetical protein